jgi:hypothetical protein
LADEPIVFQPATDAATVADDFAAVQRVVQSLQRRSPEVFRRRGAPQKPRQRRSASDAARTLSFESLQRLRTLLARRFKEPAKESNSIGIWLSWLGVGTGLAAFTCGGVMLVWSAVATRPELWSTGCSLAMAGEAGLLVGCLGLLERAVRQGRQAREALQFSRRRWRAARRLAHRVRTSHARRAA